MKARFGSVELLVLMALAVLPAAIGGLLADQTGLRIGVAIGLGAALIALRLLVPGPPARPRKPRPAVQSNADFPRYRALLSAVGWARVSHRHFDRTLRPVLLEIARARLADRRGIDLDARPDLARNALGADLWAMVDPSVAPSEDSFGGGVPNDAVGRAIERLERL